MRLTAKKIHLKNSTRCLTCLKEYTLLSTWATLYIRYAQPATCLASVHVLTRSTSTMSTPTRSTSTRSVSTRATYRIHFRPSQFRKSSARPRIQIFENLRGSMRMDGRWSDGRTFGRKVYVNKVHKVSRLPSLHKVKHQFLKTAQRVVS